MYLDQSHKVMTNVQASASHIPGSIPSIPSTKYAYILEKLP